MPGVEMPGLLRGVVKQVLSGDTVLVMGLDASKGPPPEKQISLASLVAPRLGNRNTEDQPFAWASREFLRTKVIGKVVSFRVEYQNQGGRDFGSLFDPDNNNVSFDIVSNGWATVKKPGMSEPRSTDYDELVRLERGAQDQQLGVFNQAAASAAVRKVLWPESYNCMEVLQQMKGTPQDAIIEQVAAGSTLRVLLLPSFHYVTLFLSGVQCPQIKRNPETGEEDAMPFSREAKYFTEVRLLNRDVKVMLEGVDKNQNLFGTVLHPMGNMSVELLKVGLAKVVEWSVQLTTNAGALRAAEKEARTKQMRLWKDFQPQGKATVGEFSGKVVEVVSGDTLMVMDGTTERRITLSSIRPPKMGNERRGEPGEPYAMEAKEYMRKTVVGKKIKVVPEYSRSFAVEGVAGMERTFATCWLGDKNLAEKIVSEGLCTVSRHGGADERSMYYENLLEAEQTAMDGKKGLHSTKPPPINRLNDLTLPNTKDRAKAFLPFLQRDKKVRAVVQYVVSGTRLKLLVPKENCVIMFAVIGVRCPMRNRDGQGSEPFAEEAFLYTRHTCFQRDVEIEVETMDKNGTFLGALYTPDKKNLATTLLEEGLAARVPGSADRSFHAHELLEAEEKAKAARLKVWKDYVEGQDDEVEEEVEEAPADSSNEQVTELTVTDIVDGGHFYAHVSGDQGVALVAKHLESMTAPSKDSDFAPAQGATCAAQFSQDNQWYRARVIKVKDSQYSVFFIDFGNTDTVDASRLAPLDAAISPLAIPPQAIECFLAYLKVPAVDEEFGEDAAMELGKTMGYEMVAKVEYRMKGQLFVSMFDKETQTNINHLLVEQGLARVERRKDGRSQETLRLLREKQDEAKSARAGMWEYGDIDDDDEAMEFGMRREVSKAKAGKK